MKIELIQTHKYCHVIRVDGEDVYLVPKHTDETESRYIEKLYELFNSIVDAKRKDKTIFEKKIIESIEI